MFFILNFKNHEQTENDLFLLKNTDLFLCVLMIIFLVYGSYIFIKFKKELKQKENNQISVENIRSMNSSYVATISSYIFPLFSLGVDGWRGTVIFLIALILTMCLYNKTDDYYSSLLFYLFSFNIYSAEYEEDGSKKEIIILSKHSIHDLEGKKIKIRYFEDKENVPFVTRVCIEKGVEKRDEIC